MACDTLTVVCLILSAIAGFLAYWYFCSRPKNAPPGPVGLPYIGYGPFLSSDPFMDFEKMGKKFKSNIIGLHLGPVFTVVLNDWAAVRAAFVEQDEIFCGRPKEQFVTNYHATGDDGKIHSIIALEGPKWKEQHDFIVDGLVELGVEKPKMEGPILQEIEDLIAAILDEPSSFHFRRLTSPIMSSIVARQCVGYRWGPNSSQFESFIEGSGITFQLLAGSPLQVMPWIRYIPGPWQEKWPIAKAVTQRQQSFFRDCLKKHEETYRTGVVRDLADIFLRQLKGEGSLKTNTFEDHNDFVPTITTVFEAGGESTNDSLQWAILFLLHYPDVQRKIHEELDAKVGRKRLIALSDRDFLPYTAGAVFESFRLGGNSAFGVPRCNTEETTILGHRIPKRSMLLMNIWACHRNALDWKHPREFNPDNWINENGHFEIPECFLAFSAGSRTCPAKELAKMMVFMVFANLLRKFEFVNPENQKLPSLHDYIPGISDRAKPFKVRAIPRF